MKLKFQYGGGALVLPDTVTEKMDRATDQDLRILLCLAANPYVATDGERAIREVAARLSLEKATVEVSLSFWRGTGVIVKEEDQAPPEKPRAVKSVRKAAANAAIAGAGNPADAGKGAAGTGKNATGGASGAGNPVDAGTVANPGNPAGDVARTAKKKPAPQAAAESPTAPGAAGTAGKETVLIPEKGLPVYSAEELENLIAGNAAMQELLNAAQQVFGKIFNTAEFSVVVGMVDHLGFDGEYVLLILSHCRRMNKKSIRYAEKVALSLHDEGITDARNLEEHLHAIERTAQAEGRIRKMFGIGARQLTPKEKAMIGKWVGEMAFSTDVIQKAYEITVDSTKEHTASLSYANTILERWHAAGLRTAEDVDASLAEYKKKKENNASSFDVDEFFAAALKRTYGG